MTTITLDITPLFLNRLGSWEIIIIVLVGLLLFGAKRIPDMMRGMGKGVHAFKQGIEDAKAEISKPVVKNGTAAEAPAKDVDRPEAAETRQPVATAEAKDRSE